MAVRNPLEWSWDNLTFSTAGGNVYAPAEARTRTVPRQLVIRRIGVDDLRDALSKGAADFGASRTDILFLCIIYPLVGLVLARFAFGQGVLPLLFPLAAGFALLGPFAAVGLNEMSRRRESGAKIGWPDAFGVFRSPAFGSVLLLGALMMAIFVVWLAAAEAIYMVTLGPMLPTSMAAFTHDVLATSRGWAMIVLGCGVGFVFSVAVLTISVVSFPLLLDRNVTVGVAIRTSIAAVKANPTTMAIWGLVIVAGLVVGSIPLLIGLTIVMPVLGHATWHLYRKTVAVS